MSEEQKRYVAFCADGFGLNVYSEGYGDQNGHGYFVFDESQVEWDYSEGRNKGYGTTHADKEDLICLRDWLCVHFPLFETTNDNLFEGMQMAVEAAMREDVDDQPLAVTRAVFAFMREIQR